MLYMIMRRMAFHACPPSVTLKLKNGKRWLPRGVGGVWSQWCYRQSRVQLKSASGIEDNGVSAPPLVLWHYSVILTDVAVTTSLLDLKENISVIGDIVR